MTRIRKATAGDEDAAWDIVTEYNDAVDVEVRDDRVTLRAYLDGPGALWLAEDDDRVAGCVALRPLPEVAPRACEVKRLYVRPRHRGKRIADALMTALESHARDAGYDAAYLDSKDDLQTAIRFYRRRGYAEIAPYNDNPQATIFMRLALVAET